MIVFAIAVTFMAIVVTGVVCFGNLERMTGTQFIGGGLIGLAWLVTAFFWLAWAFK